MRDLSKDQQCCQKLYSKHDIRIVCISWEKAKCFYLVLKMRIYSGIFHFISLHVYKTHILTWRRTLTNFLIRPFFTEMDPQIVKRYRREDGDSRGKYNAHLHFIWAAIFIFTSCDSTAMRHSTPFTSPRFCPRK